VKHCLAVLALASLAPAPASAAELAPARAAPRLVTIAEALAGVKRSNLNWQALDEYLAQAEAVKRIGIGMFLPKLQVEGQWVHQGERHMPDLSGFSDLGTLMGTLAVLDETHHPEDAATIDPMLAAMGGGGAGSTFDAFIPPKDMLSATFSVVVPILTPESIPALRGALSQRDATIQRIGFGRSQLLFGVAKAFYGLLTLQSMINVADKSLESARQHFKSNQVKASLQAATQLEVKRAELEVTQAESRIVELNTTLEKAKASFRYLTALGGDFAVVEPVTEIPLTLQGLDAWQKTAADARQDLIAARIEIEVADREVGKVIARYFPTINLIAQGKADNSKQMRFDDDPYSWLVMGTATLNIFDGGIREAQYSLAKSQFRQKQLAAKDLAAKVQSDVEAAYQALDNARAASHVAERQLDVAHTTQDLAIASEKAGASTNLEIIDTNTAVFAAEAQGLSARFNESMAVLDMLAAAGQPVPFAGTTPPLPGAGENSRATTSPWFFSRPGLGGGLPPSPTALCCGTTGRGHPDQ
jgi:outer membrane protein TolC